MFIFTKEYAEWQQEGEDECECGIHLLLPVGGIGSVSYTLIELLDKGTSCHMENKELRVNRWEKGKSDEESVKKMTHAV